jgi:hypothetical protein
MHPQCNFPTTGFPAGNAGYIGFIPSSKHLITDVCLHWSNHVVLVPESRWVVRHLGGNATRHPCLHARLFRGSLSHSLLSRDEALSTTRTRFMISMDRACHVTTDGQMALKFSTGFTRIVAPVWGRCKLCWASSTKVV